MLTLTVRYIAYDGMTYEPEDRLQGPWELISEDKYTGTREELEAKMNEIDDIDEATHFYDFDDNGRWMFIS